MDDLEPDCAACPLPPLGETGQRVLLIREMLHRLKGLIDAATILQMYGASRDDIELIALVESLQGGSPVDPAE